MSKIIVKYSNLGIFPTLPSLYLDKFTTVCSNDPIFKYLVVGKNFNNTGTMQFSDIIGMFRKLTLNSGIKQQFIPLLCQYGHTGLDRTRVKIYLLQLHVPQKFLLTRYSFFFTTIVVFKISMRMLFEYFSFQSSPYNIGHN